MHTCMLHVFHMNSEVTNFKLVARAEWYWYFIHGTVFSYTIVVRITNNCGMSI